MNGNTSVMDRVGIGVHNSTVEMNGWERAAHLTEAVVTAGLTYDFAKRFGVDLMEAQKIPGTLAVVTADTAKYFGGMVTSLAATGWLATRAADFIPSLDRTKDSSIIAGAVAVVGIGSYGLGVVSDSDVDMQQFDASASATTIFEESYYDETAEDDGKSEAGDRPADVHMVELEFQSDGTGILDNANLTRSLMRIQAAMQEMGYYVGGDINGVQQGNELFNNELERLKQDIGVADTDTALTEAMTRAGLPSLADGDPNTPVLPADALKLLSTTESSEDTDG